MPGDTWQSVNPVYPQFPITNLWDGIVDVDPNIFIVQGGSIPLWFTVDMGIKVIFSKMEVFQRPHGAAAAREYWPKEFSIWGSNAPDVDGSWNNWHLLGTFNYNASNQFSQSFSFPDNLEGYRYFRFKVLDTYGETDGFQLTELSFWGIIQ